MNNLKNLNEIFNKGMSYHGIKSHKKPRLHTFSEKIFFRKTTGRSIRRLDVRSPETQELQEIALPIWLITIKRKQKMTFIANTTSKT